MLGVVPAFTPGADNPLDEPLRVGDDNRWSVLSAGGSHACAIKTTGFTKKHPLYCWGDYASGQLGIGEVTEYVGMPEKVLDGNDWDSVTAGKDFTCAKKTGGTLYCWGADASGQLGDGADTGGSNVPKEIMVGMHWKLISAGSEHACAITNENQLFCWGLNSFGQIGNGKTENQPAPVRITRLAATVEEPAFKDENQLNRNFLTH